MSERPRKLLNFEQETEVDPSLSLEKLTEEGKRRLAEDLEEVRRRVAPSDDGLPLNTG